jgi:hypothetical protein
MVVLLLPFLEVPLRADMIIDNTGSWDGTTNVSPFGPPNTETYGELVTAPGDNVLKSWTFLIKASTAEFFRGEVYQWNPVTSRAVGPDLFESFAMSTSDATLFQAITFDTGGITLLPSAEYVLFATTSKETQSEPGGGAFGLIPSGSGFVFQNNGSDSSQWTTSQWISPPVQLAFRADFAQSGPAPIPEPSSIVLLLSVITLCKVAQAKR